MIRTVKIETDHGDMDVTVEINPNSYVIRVTPELVDFSDLRQLSMVIARAIRTVHLK